jgi:putative endopeptidase
MTSRLDSPRSSCPLCHLAGLGLAGILILAFPAGTRAADRAQKPQIGDCGLDLTARDTTVDPGNDFFRYANGSWLASYQIPEDLAGYGSFTKLALLSEDQIKSILEDLAKEGAAPGTPAWKIGELYSGYLDVAARDAKGLAPLDPYFKEVRAATTPEDIARLMGKYSRTNGGGFGGGMSPFPFFVDQDEKDPSRYLAHFFQGGLGLPDRDYYLKTDNPRFATARDAYKEYLTTIFTLAGESDPDRRADKIIALENKIAEVHWPREDMRNVDKTYNVMGPSDLTSSAPGFPWDVYLQAAGIADQKELVVAPPSAFTGMAKVFRETPIETWQDFLVYRLMRNNADCLPSDVDDATFDFTSKAITGAKEQRDRWKRAVHFTNRAMGDALGKIYVEKYFSPVAKQRIDELVQNLLVAMGDRIDHLDWMSPETKKAARTKLSKFNVKIGYPDTWRDYSGLDIEKGDLLGNSMRARAFNYDYNVAKLGKPVDRKEWLMTPQTVNAYYNSGMNEIVFPAAILQPPFFDPYADDAVNYGAIGAVIGHEIGHGFDDQGRKSDGDGVLRDWWTEDDAARFKARTDALVARYDAFSPLEGMHVNGQLTLGENIGDLGGLEIAHYAYQLSLKGKDAPVIDGLTGDQRFFLSFAQIWRGKMRDAILATQVSSDPHSPVEFRVNGPLPNVDTWYAAFGVKEGDALYLAPDKRIHIW